MTDVLAAIAEVDARLDPEWVVNCGEWSKGAALALIGTTAPSARPKGDRNGGDGAERDDAE